MQLALLQAYLAPFQVVQDVVRGDTVADVTVRAGDADRLAAGALLEGDDSGGNDSSQVLDDRPVLVAAPTGPGDVSRRVRLAAVLRQLRL